MVIEIDNLEERYSKLSVRDGNGTYAIALAILQLCEVQRELVREITRLGYNDAHTPMGAMEAMALKLSEAIDGVAVAIAEGKGDA